MEQPTMEGYFASSLDMELAENLLVQQPCNVLTSQQYYYEYPNSADYLLAPPLSSYPDATQTIYSSNDTSQFNFAVSTNTCQAYAPVYAAPFYQPNSIDHFGLPLESSVFLSPQTSTSSSAAQSPQAEASLQNEALDLPLDEIFSNVDDILSEELITDELLEALNDVGCSDFLSQLEFTDQTSLGNESCFNSDSSVSSTPKRKYSSDSSDCYSVNSFETTSSSSSSGDNKKVKKARRSKASLEEKVARKKDQNKKAASRYRNKKKNEVESCEQTVEELESQRDELAEQLKKLQTEFSVILPLASAAFTFDKLRLGHLSQLISRVNALL